MKRRNPYVRSIAPCRTQQLADAFFHDRRGFVGESYSEDRAARHAHLNQVRHAISDHSRLARARSGKDQQGTFGRQHSLALPLIQFL